MIRSFFYYSGRLNVIAQGTTSNIGTAAPPANRK